MGDFVHRFLEPFSSSLQKFVWTVSNHFHQFLNRGMPPRHEIQVSIAWPLWLLPFLFFLLIFGPSALWVALILGVVGLYVTGYFWVRSQLPYVSLERQREGTMLVVGDSLLESFSIQNQSSLPLLWVEISDESVLPGYRPGRVVACSALSRYSWRTEALCEQRGLFRLGPQRLIIGDPFGLFQGTITDPRSEALLVYPRVAYLPPLEMPRGSLSGRDRRRRPLWGDERSSSIRTYRAGDSLRFVHWPSSARHGVLMVSELEIEPSGDLWIVLDLDASAQRGGGKTSTLEYGIMLAASVAAEILGETEQRAVGLLAAGGTSSSEVDDAPTVVLTPRPGQGQIWRFLAALAPLQPGRVPVDRLLRSNRHLLSRGESLLLITPSIGPEADSWVAELLHLGRVGVAGTVLLVEAPANAYPQDSAAAARITDLVNRYGIAAERLVSGVDLQPALTYRRKRTVLRSTPSGGVVAQEVVEEVG